MASRGDLHDRIADDLVDAPVTAAQIRAAVDDAIQDYESERFTFNEAQGISVTFTVSVDFLALSTLSVYLTKIDRLRIRVSTNTQDLSDLVPRDFSWIMDSQDAKSTGRPGAYCIYAERINLDVQADQSYTGVIDGVRRVSATASLSPTANASAWFTEAKNLLRYRAEVDLLANVVRDDGEAQKKQILLDREYKRLKQKINTRNSGRVRPSEF